MTTQGELVDLYVPRKCAATGRLIEAKDHASVQIAVADVDSEGRAIPGKNTTFALSGFVRRAGESDDSINRLATEQGCEYQSVVGCYGISETGARKGTNLSTRSQTVCPLHKHSGGQDSEGSFRGLPIWSEERISGDTLELER